MIFLEVAFHLQLIIIQVYVDIIIILNYEANLNVK